ncbi:MAG: DUF2807 domain-containing protein [Cytophagaceae bacterium]|nr:DUF2807 domain-containing protein [Cytophagaceae bacterium]
MKKTALSLLFLASAFTAFSQDWKKDRAVSGFSGVQVNGGIDLYLTQGNSEKLTLDVNGFEEEEVKVEVKNGTLKIYVDRKGSWGMNWGRNRYVKAYLTFKALNKIQANGGSDLFSQGTLTFNTLDLQINGGADAKMALKAAELNVQTNGGADVELSGSVRRLNAQGTGGSDLDAGKLSSEVCNASSSGGSDVYVYATKEITMDASGGSDIHYAGPARVAGKRKSGGADITFRD